MDEDRAATKHRRRRRGVVPLLALLLLCATAACFLLYVRASRPLYHAADDPLIARSVAAAAAHFGTSESEIRKITFPIAMDLTDRKYIELRPKRDDLPGYLACYRQGDGELLMENVRNAPLGPRRFFPPLL